MCKSTMQGHLNLLLQFYWWGWGLYGFMIILIKYIFFRVWGLWIICEEIFRNSLLWLCVTRAVTFWDSETFYAMWKEGVRGAESYRFYSLLLKNRSSFSPTHNWICELFDLIFCVQSSR